MVPCPSFAGSFRLWFCFRCMVALFVFVFLSTIFTVRLLLGLSSIPWTCEWCSPAFLSNWFFLYRVKTKVQQRALAGEKYRGPLETLHRLVRGKWISFEFQYTSLIPVGPDPTNPRPLFAGIGRLYRGLGVSALRSITTHGLLWTLFDMTALYIDNLPPSPHRTCEDK